jgi:signal transduction histidine kinase/response regulator of citrate/malate metabolism
VNVKIVKESLQDAYVVESASDGDEAIRLVRSFNPDIVVLDVMLPGISGYEVCKQIKKIPGHEYLKVIFTSGNSMPHDREAGYLAGGDDYLTKPFSYDEIVGKVNIFARLKSVEESGRELLVDNARLKLINRALRHLNKEGARLTRGGNSDAFYLDIIKQLMELIYAKFAAFVCFHQAEGIQQFFCLGKNQNSINVDELFGEAGLFKHLLCSGAPLLVSDAPSFCNEYGLSMDGLSVKNLLFMPIVINDDLLCAVYLAYKRDGALFDEHDEITLSIMTKDVAFFLQRQELLTAMQRTNLALNKEKEEQLQLIQELKEARDQLLQSEKMASLGQLAAGVAHEINNPVGYISSNLSTLSDYLSDIFNLIKHYEEIEVFLDKNSERYQNLLQLKQLVDINFLKKDVMDLVAESEEGAERVRQIVQDLKDFSHEGEEVWEYGDLLAGLNSTLNIVHNELKYKAQVIKEYGELPMVECIAPQLNQVFMNLLVNAAHAIENHGTITIRTDVDGDHVWLRFEDTGKGIQEENLTRIFDPFFTTKPVGAGTGLGLSLSYGIIKKHGGRIEVSSKIDVGTAFTVYLPIHQKSREDACVA